ncbi:hypothetical protein JAAARDRAFT_142645 [Jaapia argillacea MUCL 33604]|uniref:Metallo-beta-lactamase domain-containing protein n=1 Tax=Jaapia argillacea MUCL 33604 TaxID=933084 RepID=A0A067P5C3_9AGAM|nr:hypothetical protein JAAARDRAFT_142645 [Jaapia argillacea MUCL 33604]
MADLQHELNLSICKTCAVQYAQTSLRSYKLGDELEGDGCPICLDPRQYVPATGQSWTSWATLELDHTTKLVPEPDDERIIRIVTEPPIGIGQTPFVICTSSGILIWDCGSYLSQDTVDSILALTSPSKPLLGIAISHPHFFGASVMWAKNLGCKVFMCELDREWFMRKEDSEAVDVVEFWKGERKNFGEALTVIRCGGHFPGSCVLHWNRSLESLPTSITSLTKKGVVFCSDTFMVAPDRKTLSFMWSYPNQIPLPPKDVQTIWNSLRPFQFDDIYGAWPGRLCLNEGRERLLDAARYFVKMEGWEEGQFVFDD